jgi:hypothetical protein
VTPPVEIPKSCPFHAAQQAAQQQVAETVPVVEESSRDAALRRLLNGRQLRW